MLTSEKCLIVSQLVRHKVSPNAMDRIFRYSQLMVISAEFWEHYALFWYSFTNHHWYLHVCFQNRVYETGETLIAISLLHQLKLCNKRFTELETMTQTYRHLSCNNSTSKEQISWIFYNRIFYRKIISDEAMFTFRQTQSPPT